MASCSGPRRQRGFSYLLALALIAAVGFGLGQAGIWWKTEAQRAREADLLFVGDQYRRAIERYLNAQPSAPRFPARLEDLLEDPRFGDTRRYLRKLWRDPIDPRLDWGLIVDPETRGIMGVYSRAPGTPIKRGRFPKPYESFNDAQSYAAWKFFVPLPEKKS